MKEGHPQPTPELPAVKPQEEIRRKPRRPSFEESRPATEDKPFGLGLGIDTDGDGAGISIGIGNGLGIDPTDGSLTIKIG